MINDPNQHEDFSGTASVPDVVNPSPLVENHVNPVSSSPCLRASVVSSSASPLTFAIPRADLARFARLPDPVRASTNATLLLLRRIHSAANKSGEARALALQRRGQRGFSQESLLRKYYDYIASDGDWQVAVDRAKAGPAFWLSENGARAGLPAEFIEFWKGLCERNQRKNEPARRALLRIWREKRGLCPATGKTIHYKAIPGYAVWPQADPVTGEPAGWSSANLNRHAPDPYALAVSRVGREAASAHRRKVFTTRKGLGVGQYYLFDDQEYDLKVNWPGARQAMRPLSLNALDLYSACCIGIGFKPTLLDVEGAKKKLRERDMLFLVADVLCTKGYRMDERGTTLIVEHGTAAIRGDFEERIAAATGGKVQVQRSGLSSQHMAGLFEGASKGNPRFKASLESLFNLVRNEMAALPGQVGMGREHAPTEAAGLNRYNDKLLKLARDLAPERAALLQYPVLAWEEFVALTLDIYHRINTRTDHELEGWEKCGHVCHDFLLEFPSENPRESAQSAVQVLSQSQWLQIDHAKRKALEPFVQSRCRKLSPQEVWDAGASGLQKLGHEALPILLGPEFGEERTVRGGYIVVEDRELSSEPLRFPAWPHNSGDKFLTYLNPCNASALILCDNKGRYIGALALQDTPCRADTKAVLRQLGAARHEEAQRMAPVVARATPVIQARAAMHEQNTLVVQGQPVTNEELQAADALRARIKQHGKSALDEVISPPDHAHTEAGFAGGGEPFPTPENTEVQKAIDDVL